ncbi:MAG TPA: class I SAM-dependent methyltransferase [Alphaproteobacteria bacterium]|nr:class I SAM-dependent methyltransferase [Alphaproteobacteria bacterium]
MVKSDNYYDSIAKGYNELHAEEQLKKLEIIGKELKTNPDLSGFMKPNYSLLDVGCGTGISTGFFNCKTRIGIDPSKNLIAIAKTHYPMIDFQVCGAEDISFKDKKFDIVISLTAIQNFSDLEKGLSEIKHVGKDKFILTFLKKSQKNKQIDEFIRKKFDVIKFIDEEKDYIYFCR